MSNARRRTVSRIATLFLLAGLAAVPLSGPAAAKVTISQKTKYYTIHGSTPKAFFQSLERAAPFFDDGRALGVSRLKFNSKVKGVQTATTCRIENPDVRLEVLMTLPRWADEKRADPKLQLFWKIFSAFVRKHEEHHVEIAMKHARMLQQVYSRIPAAPDCKRLKLRLDSAARRILTQHHVQQTKFDAREQARMRRNARTFASRHRNN